MSHYERIITHNDFDGLVSAAICSHALGVDFIVFTGPRSVSDARISITAKDVVCDLPYPLECGLWFDHHQGNLEDLQLRKIDPDSVEGLFALKDSCARVVYEHFGSQGELPAHFAEMVDEADIIDAFKYQSIEDWRRETPGKMVDATIKLHAESSDKKWQYLRNLIVQLKKRPLNEISQMTGVKQRYRAFREEEEQMMEQIRQDVLFLPEDDQHHLIVIDLTRHNRRPNVLKHLAYLLYPEALSVIEVKNVFRNDVKTNDLALSMSLSLNLNSVEHHKDVGEIMRLLNIGSGHAGAGSGTISCTSKEEMLRTKMRLLGEIFSMFKQQ